MKTKAKPRTSKPKQRQRSLFDTTPMPTIKRTWKAPRIDRQADPDWVFAFVDPQQLGVHVEIPQWLESRKPK